jgi:hypothetical protein
VGLVCILMAQCRESPGRGCAFAYYFFYRSKSCIELLLCVVWCWSFPQSSFDQQLGILTPTSRFSLSHWCRALNFSHFFPIFAPYIQNCSSSPSSPLVSEPLWNKTHKHTHTHTHCSEFQPSLLWSDLLCSAGPVKLSLRMTIVTCSVCAIQPKSLPSWMNSFLLQIHKKGCSLLVFNLLWFYIP